MPLFAGILLVDRRGWVLLQQRDEHPLIDPEKWALVGGHVDPGETFEQCAYRELAEEAGVHAEPGGLTHWRDFEISHDVHDEPSQMAVYAAAVDLTDADIVLGEGRQIVFVAPERIAALDLSTSARKVVPLFLCSELYATMAS